MLLKASFSFFIVTILLGGAKTPEYTLYYPPGDQGNFPSTMINTVLTGEIANEVKEEAKAMGYVNAHLDISSNITREMNNYLDVQGPLTGTHPVFFAREVTSDAELNPNYSVTFEATQSITLRPGFSAKAGGTFTARIVEICDGDGDNARSLLNTHLGNKEE